MRAVSRRETCLICGASLKGSLILVGLCLCFAAGAMAESARAGSDFDRWMESEQGQKASPAQMKQRCDTVMDAEEHLSCSVSVLARLFESKAANLLPEFYLATKRRHARAIEQDPELKALFSMFGDQSLEALRAVGNFSLTRAKQREVLPIHPFPSDHYVTDEVLPYIEVKAANGVTSRFIVDTGAPQTRVNLDTAKLMGIQLLPDARYRYSTFYGEHDLSASLGIFESLRIGTSEFRNVLVFVSDRDNLLGLDLLAKLGRLKVTKKTLTLNAEPPARCDSPITYTRLDINQRLTLPARLEHRATVAIIDTGNVDYLTSALPGSTAIQVTGKPRSQTFRGELSMGGHIQLSTYKYFPDFTIPPSMLLGKYVPSILLGWQAFKDFELNLDVDSGRSCFNRI
ncbi:hypothetical protein EJA72_22835 [Pseudomonas sp. PB120]|uniref:retropepsin-like aspartic protease n=1 Tax=Pseudomonas sp. PB120 TaxID=2494700 RepID=UPI0012FE51ED|nr:retropepsin-like aspartic protease [Pseudomonas sp. PB120]MVV51054.1 hypothetical protein [Pseudomonas sp. PB120]